MAVNKILVVGSTLAVAVISGWMIMSASDVPTAPDPTKSTAAAVQKSGAVPTKTSSAPVSHAPKAEAAPDTLQKTAERDTRTPHLVVPQEKLSHLYIVKCSACHGRDGKGPVGPSIAGKGYEDNLAILRKYKRNEVENTMMEDLLTRTSEEELKSLSREISTFK